MSLHPLAERFATVAGAYERGRPGYPPAVAGAIAAELGVPPGAPVLDLGAGTGKLTRVLLGAGLDVVGVEPHGSLREVLAAGVGPERVREGLAEAIPLPDGSVAAVTVGDAFHWFKAAEALGEIRRVLRPGGGLAVLATIPDWREASWAHEVGTLMESMRPEHPFFDGTPWREAVRAAGAWSEPREVRVSTSRPTDLERTLDFIASMSWVAAMSEEERAEMLGKIRALIEAGETPAEMPVHVLIGLSSLT
ncbi:MAG TPA: class I SAM-dependent methyltransferase [Solirubrobacteraceae bacterium]|jgi:SAM-dependent methyltransferase|nr:class I SAM-dependent methyltransferase [Solirubrobacteraceae bacterium]